MSLNDYLQIGVLLVVLVGLAIPLGAYIFGIFQDQGRLRLGFIQRFEQLIYRMSGINPLQQMDWIQYLQAMLCFNALALVFAYALQRLQAYLPLNPAHWANLGPGLALNTAASFVTNTNWQAYAGERTMSYLTQMLALTAQNFLSAATGLALLMAFIRGLVAEGQGHLGNYWVDLVRAVLYLLLPLSILFAGLLISQGVIQNFKPNQSIAMIERFSPNHQPALQTIPMGPVASQVAIKQLGSNGGGFFLANAAHPFENPTSLSNFLELLAILLIPAALCLSFGSWIQARRQGWALLLLMLSVLLLAVFATYWAERHGQVILQELAIQGGNMEGKETRFGILNSSLWMVATTATSNGSTNAILESFTPMGSGIPLALMLVGEVILGGLGSGLYGMLLIFIISAFIGGLMIGRSPMFFGKKIETFEMKMACIALLMMPVTVLIATSIALCTSLGQQALGVSGAHGLTQALYAMSSMMNSNGSAFSGLNANNPVYLLGGSVLMLWGRYGFAIPLLAIAGALSRKKKAAATPGTLSTDSGLFVLLLLGVMIIVGALSFFPALVLGPMVEQLNAWGSHG